MELSWVRGFTADKQAIVNLGAHEALVPVSVKAVHRMQRGVIRICLNGFMKSMLLADVSAAKMFLRSAVKESGGYALIAQEIRVPEKSIIRMLGPKGNPQAIHLFEIIGWIAERWDVYPSIK